MYYKRLRDLRDDADLSQKQVADLLGINQRAYSNYETGKREIPSRFLILLADYYHVTIDYILGRTDKPT
jgi:transcriptional regulator with XRE-family HTH domain